MGSYDTVHTGTRCGQTKALGKGLRDLTVGDAARLYPAPMDEAAFEVYLRGETAPVADDFQVVMGEGYLVVRDAVIVGWVGAPVDDLPAFDGLGRPVDLAAVTAAAQAAAVKHAANVVPFRRRESVPETTAAAELRAILGEVPDGAEPCVVCAQIRGVGAAQFRANRDEAARLRRERRQQQRAARDAAKAAPAAQADDDDQPATSATANATDNATANATDNGADHVCDTGHFDRSVCPEPCGTMHSYCARCGTRQDSCSHDPSVTG